MHTSIPLSATRLQALLSIPDLTLDPVHAIALMVDTLQSALSDYPSATRIHGSPLADAAHNYTLLGYPPDAVVQDSTYTHWVDHRTMLRTQTTATILQALLDLSPDLRPQTLLAPGMVYRRDVRDRWHCAQPHQMDIWILLPAGQASPGRLLKMVHDLARAGIPGVELDIRPAQHPYTQQGIEINARWQDQWLEIGEAGLIDPALLARVGVDPSQWGGLAMGIGLDRWVMVRKDLPDIRLLRDPLPAIARQMRDLTAWKTISRQPHAHRELSVACRPGLSEEDLTERVLEALGEEGKWLQTMLIKGRWSLETLPEAAVSKLGAHPGQENLLVKLTWQDPSGSLPRDRVNAMSRVAYRALHEGTGWEYCP